MKTITLELEMNFTEAIQYLLDGKCIGIKPKGNSSFLVKYKPNSSFNYFLCWSRSVRDGKGNEAVRSDQYLETWQPVVIDTNDLPDDIKQLFLE